MCSAASLGLVGLSAVAGVLITATVTPAIALSGAAATSAITMFDNLPSVLDIDKLMLPTTLYAKNPDTGEDVELAQFYDQNRSPVEFDEVNPVMYDAILSSEDPRFYQHGGVDLIGTSRALLQNVQRRRRDAGWLLHQPAVRQEHPDPALRAGCRDQRRAAQLLDRCDTAAAPRASSASSRRCATPSHWSRSIPRTTSFSATSTSPTSAVRPTASTPRPSTTSVWPPRT